MTRLPRLLPLMLVAMLTSVPSAHAMSLNFEQIQFTTDPGVTITFIEPGLGGSKDPTGAGRWEQLSLGFTEFRPFELGLEPASDTVSFKGSDEELGAD